MAPALNGHRVLDPSPGDSISTCPGPRPGAFPFRGTRIGAGGAAHPLAARGRFHLDSGGIRSAGERRLKTQVVIVGAGPVGLTLAIDLGRRGVRCTLVEQKQAPQFLPKMERCNARTMEIYRRMGLAERIRAAGLPRDVPMDVFIVTTLTEPPLLHLPYPSVAAAQAQIRACNDGSLPLEPYQLISQYTLEPLLKSVAETMPGVTVRYGCEFLSFAQDAGAVRAKVRADGGIEEIECDYMVGCDGGASTVRRQLGIKLEGEANLLQLRQALYRCDDLFERIPIGKGRHYHVADAHNSFLIVQDSTRHFTLHATLDSDEAMKTQFERVVDMPVEYEMLSCAPWRQNLLLADGYGKGRVFLAGDAVHLVIPTGGLGMNSGVGDAVDLSWKLAATLQGWGGPKLLASYEAERRPVGARNVAASRFAARGRRAWRAAYRPNIRDKTPEGAATRANLARIADVEQRKSNEMIGAELGYRYDNSPLVWPEAGEPPEDNVMKYVPTTWPGARLPHLWLADGTALHDRIGDGYTLLRLHGAGDGAEALARAFAAYRAPFAELKIADAHARDVYGYDLLLLRPDLHVAWRGNRLPDDPAKLAAVATGH
jgi:2-polyprenyl-6-methoxyphenol hydroxylase-like FAD-dependent oxidoreductase